MKSPVEKRALVIGGGISGIQAVLDVSLAGYKVTLVEKLPTIGGRMAQLEKTFPIRLLGLNTHPADDGVIPR